MTSGTFLYILLLQIGIQFSNQRIFICYFFRLNAASITYTVNVLHGTSTLIAKRQQRGQVSYKQKKQVFCNRILYVSLQRMLLLFPLLLELLSLQFALLPLRPRPWLLVLLLLFVLKMIEEVCYKLKCLIITVSPVF